MKFPLSKVGWFKVMIAVIGVFAVAIVSLIIISVLFVFGVGYAKGEAEIANMVIGSWTTDADTLGKIQVIEVFNKDGTWVYGNSDDILRKGKWQYIDEMQIKINETEVTNDNVSESVNHERLIAIIDLKYDEIVCKEGNRQFVLKRIRHPGFPKSSLNNEEVE